jgi:hypothetical protein
MGDLPEMESRFRSVHISIRRFIPIHSPDSDIIHLNVAGKSIIILSSLEATNDLMVQRSAIYSDR